MKKKESPRTALELSPVEMTPGVMQDLEARGLIIRLCPNHHELPVDRGEAASRSIYESDSRYGPHKLITVTVDRPAFATFGSHPDNEEFLFIGDPSTKPLYLAVALHRKEVLEQKAAARELTPEDFICLKVRYNDPEASFFTMLAHVPHDEAAADTGGRPGSFYVTEPCDMGRQLTDLGPYELVLPK